MNKIIKTVLVVMAIIGTIELFMTNIYAGDIVSRSINGDYYYIISDDCKQPVFKYHNGVLDVDDAYVQAGKNYINDLDTWYDMKHYNYGATLEHHYAAKQKVSELAATFNYGSDYDKYKRIYDYIVSTTDYNYAGNEESFTVYGCLINQYCVCEGMAKAYIAIALEMGLQCYLRHSSSHAWNAILLDGEWYVCDCTGYSFAQDPSRWPMDYAGEEYANALNEQLGITPITQYASLQYADHGYESSDTIVTDSNISITEESKEKEEEYIYEETDLYTKGDASTVPEDIYITQSMEQDYMADNSTIEEFEEITEESIQEVILSQQEDFDDSHRSMNNNTEYIQISNDTGMQDVSGSVSRRNRSILVPVIIILVAIVVPLYLLLTITFLRVAKRKKIENVCANQQIEK